MKINERLSIEAGNECFTVIESKPGRNPKTGEAITSTIKTFHPTIGQCAKKIVRSETLSALDSDDLWEAVSRIEACTNRLTAILEQSK